MDPAQTGRTPHTLLRNLIIFTISIVASGWVGIAIDKLTGQPDYQDVATLNGGGTLGMGVWTVAPLLVVIALRTFCGDGWKNAGYALNVRGNGWLYALSIAVYPATTCVVILLGTQVGAMHVAALNMSAILTLIASQFVIQCAKNFFEESLWRVISPTSYSSSPCPIGSFTSSPGWCGGHGICPTGSSCSIPKRSKVSYLRAE